MNNQKPTNPNAQMNYAVREALSVIAGPIAGQTRNHNFTCRGNDEYEEIKNRLMQEFTQAGILDTDDFDVVKEAENHHNGIDYIAGRLDLHISFNKYSENEIKTRQKNAFAYIEEKTEQIRKTHQNAEEPVIKLSA